ncbi:hypothetical protein LTR08_004917 [Meristemomyces frigidus]|nr:hypothetical protein LTR08_004917 [Meristemomyces frigidus]
MAMLPPSGGRYASYKAGTQSIVRWLTTTVARCSIAHTNAHLNQSVSVNDLLRFATIIARSSVEIPAAILELLLEVMSSRQYCADWFSAQSLSGPEDATAVESSNQSHRHFVTVLQQTHELLKAARKEQRVGRGTSRNEAAAASRAGAEAEEGLSSRFAQLEVEEPSESPLGAEPYRRPAQDELAQLTDCATLDVDDGAEKEFAIWCLLEDLYELRTYLRATWSDYATGTLSFVTASAVTDFAFSMMRQADRDLVAVYPDMNNIIDVMTTLGLACLVSDADGRPCIVKLQSEGPVDAGDHANELLCPLASHTLYVVEERWVAIYEPSYQERSQIVCPDHPFSMALLSAHGAITNGIMSGNYQQSDRSQDEFVDAFWNHYKKGERRIWHVVACQSYMDIFKAIKNRAEVGVVEFCRAVQQTKATVDTLEKLYYSYKSSTGQKILKVLRQKLAPDYAAEEALTHTGVDEDANKLFRSLPVTMGERLYDHKMLMHIMGLEIVNDGSAVLAMAHLYRAARHYGMLETEWKDMDWLIETHSQKHQLVPGVAAGADEMALVRHFEIAVGVSPSALTVSKRNIRRSRDNALRASNGQVARRSHERRITTASTFIEAYIAEVEDRETSRGVIPSILESLRTAKANAHRTGSHKQAATSFQLLQKYRGIVVADEPQLDFGYIAFWMKCVNLLSEVKSKTLRLLPKDLQPTIKSEVELVIALLYDAAIHRHASRPLDQYAFGFAVETLRETVKNQGGDVSTKHSFEPSSGHLPIRDEQPGPELSQDATLASAIEETAGDSKTTPAQAKTETEDVQKADVRAVFAAQKKGGGRKLLRKR